MSAGDRFLKANKLTAVLRVNVGGECGISGLSILDDRGIHHNDFLHMPLIVREGERLVLEHRKGSLTLFRANR